MAAAWRVVLLQRLCSGRWRPAALSKPAWKRGASGDAAPDGRRRLCVAVVCGAAAAAASWCYYEAESQAGRRRWALLYDDVRIPVVKAKNAIEEIDFEDVELYVSSQEQRFRLFASLEYDGQFFMTPRDFIESVTTDEPRSIKPRKSLSRQDLENMLSETPPAWKGSSRLFRTLCDRGLIAYTEYLFLLCILTSESRKWHV